jgi:hypothetical protein
MKKLLIAAVVLALTVPAAAPAFAQQVRYYDSRGKLGTVTTSLSGQTTFRDSRGNTIGTATRDSQGTTTFRDNRGNVTGRASGGRR